MPNNKPKLAVSACLCGHEVYHNGGHKRAKFITDKLSPFFELIPICPEVGIGLGAPRPTMHLIGTVKEQRMVVINEHDEDYTEKLINYAQAQKDKVQDVCGYIFKSKSPSCGIDRVKIYSKESGIPIPEQTNGIYMRTIEKQFPLLPYEDEGRLNDVVLRENFLERVYVYHRWQKQCHAGMTIKSLIEFHSRHKMLIMTRGSSELYQLGRLLGENKLELNSLAKKYFSGLMQLLAKKANNQSHTNVMMHMMGYVKKHLTKAQKTEMLEVIEKYRKGLIPLVAPLTLLKHHFNEHPHPYISYQYYLDPYPEELMLRNI